MKQVLSLLLSFVFLQTQTWAISGGPFGGGSGSVDVIGTYAGVLIPDSESAGGSAASIGLFSFGVPEAGVATGSAVVFVEGTAFNGTITGVADPASGAFKGIVDAISTYQVLDPNFPGANFRVFAQGNIEADIVSASLGTAGGVRVEGTATLDIFGTLEADNTPAVTSTSTYIVEGFKQSDTPSSTPINVGTPTP